VEWLHIYNGPDGESHFKQYDDPGSEDSPFPPSTSIPATSIVFVHRPESAGPGNWHNPSQRQLIIRLAGEMEIETSDGDVRHVGPGSVILAEDSAGKGHRVSRVSGDGIVGFVKLLD
jgi:hypothetical protein